MVKTWCSIQFRSATILCKIHSIVLENYPKKYCCSMATPLCFSFFCCNTEMITSIFGIRVHLRDWTKGQGCVQFRVESTLTHSTQFSFELTFELIFECATLWMPIHWAEWGFIGLVRTIPFNSHSRIDSLLSKSSHGWECECARMAFELDTTLAFGNRHV